MTQATIVLAKDGLDRSAAGLVCGGLYVQAGEFQFPDLRWTDFVVVVLGWWCRALSRVLTGDRTPVEVRFMEGPYLVEIGPKSAQSIHLKLIEAGLSRRVHLEADAPMHILADSVLAAAARALAECEARGWWSDDEDELADAMVVLQQEKSRAVN